MPGLAKPLDLQAAARLAQSRDKMAQQLDEFNKREQLQQAMALCDTQTLTIPFGYGNSYAVRVLVHSPKYLQGKPGKIACVSLHRGTGVAGSVELNAPYGCQLAISVGCVVFNAEYLLPGVRLSDPDGQQKGEQDVAESQDMSKTSFKWATIDQMANGVIAVIRYVREQYKAFEIDYSKVILEGMEGGGFALAATCSRLAQLGEASMLKLVISSCAFYPSYHAGDGAGKNNSQGAITPENLQDTAGLILQAYSPSLPPASPLLFPLAPSSQDILSLWPPSIIITSESDYNLIPNAELSGNLKVQGRLLEFLKYGSADGAKFFPLDLRASSQYWTDLRLAVETYVGQIDGYSPVILEAGADGKKPPKK